MGIPFGDDRWEYYADEIDKECTALQAKLEAREEAEFWEEWGDVPNICYNWRQVEMPAPVAADNDEAEDEDGDDDDGGHDDDDDGGGGGDDDDEWYVDIIQD
ncbi:uncharacterized protein LOC135147121 [Daucus carota subsp. sativus]|uniref:uncharacterized protein LOC135147121 n=1 Tax=Daucus carota subsp. sativus TaxID=79200 RepID=UPI0030832645